MAEYFQFYIDWPAHGWTLLAVFRDGPVCDALAELVRLAWQVAAQCVQNEGV